MVMLLMLLLATAKQSSRCGRHGRSPTSRARSRHAGALTVSLAALLGIVLLLLGTLLTMIVALLLLALMSTRTGAIVMTA